MQRFKVIPTSIKGYSILSEGYDGTLANKVNIQLPNDTAYVFCYAYDMLSTLNEVHDFLSVLQSKTRSANSYEKYRDIIDKIEEVIDNAEGRKI